MHKLVSLRGCEDISCNASQDCPMQLNFGGRASHSLQRFPYLPCREFFVGFWHPNIHRQYDGNHQCQFHYRRGYLYGPRGFTYPQSAAPPPAFNVSAYGISTLPPTPHTLRANALSWGERRRATMRGAEDGHAVWGGPWAVGASVYRSMFRIVEDQLAHACEDR